MFVAAIILLLVSVLLIVAAIFGGGADATLDLGSFELNWNTTGIFFLGMFTLLLLVLSLGMFRTAVRRGNARRAERKQMGELSEKLDAYQRHERDSGRTEGDQ